MKKTTTKKKKNTDPAYHMNAGSGIFKNLAHRKSFFLASKSTIEKKWFQDSSDFISVNLAGEIVWSCYEGLSLKIPGGRYTPDWVYLLQHPDSSIRCICVEIKGSIFQKNYRATRQALRAAASLYTWMDFYQIMYKSGGEWQMEKIDRDEFFLDLIREDLNNEQNKNSE